MHNIEYYTFDENVNRAKAEKEINEFVQGETRGEGGHGLPSPVRWLERIDVCDDYESAQNAIKRNDKGWYDQLAVRYYWPEVKQTKALAALRGKAEAARDKKHESEMKVWAATIHRDYVVCRVCGSKLKRKYIRTNQCPVCYEDMRPETFRKEVNAAVERSKKADQAVKDYIKQHSKKQIKWLVKIEYLT